MVFNNKNITSYKYTLLLNIINNKKNKSLYNELDNLLLGNRFKYISEQSFLENILRVGIEPCRKEIIDIIDNFITSVKNKTVYKNRSIYEVLKLSFLPSKKIDNIIDKTRGITLGKKLQQVSHETLIIKFDFIILKTLDMLLLKISDFDTKSYYKEIKQQVLKKILLTTYKKEKGEKECSFLSMIDTILSLTIEKQYTADNFTEIIKKIFYLSDYSLSVLWKALYATNYLLLQQDYSANSKIRSFRKEIVSNINQKYYNLQKSVDDLKNLVTNTLAKKSPSKEDFYYLFDTLSIISKKSEEQKEFCFALIRYIILHNSKQNIFCFRFIRKYFYETVLRMINDTDSAKLKDIEIQTLISLFHVDSFFCFSKHDIFRHIVKLLKSIRTSNTKLSHNNFYKYCDILDYIMALNRDIHFPNIIDYLSNEKKDRLKIQKCFNLSQDFLVY